MPTKRMQAVKDGSKTETSGRRGRQLSPEKIYNLLMKARTAPEVSLYFADQRSVKGAVIFNEYKGTGRIINVDEEISIDFTVDQLRDVKL